MISVLKCFLSKGVIFFALLLIKAIILLSNIIVNLVFDLLYKILNVESQQNLNIIK